MAERDAARLRAVPRPHEHLRRPRQPAAARAPLRVARDRLRARRRGPRRRRSTPTRTTSSTSAAARTATRRCARRTWSTPSATRCTPRPRAARVVLAVCGGYQLLGHAYELGDERIPGVGLVDLRTVREDGPAADRQRRDRGRPRRPAAPRVLAGFENHGGRTHLGAGEQPLGRVLTGHGNNGARRASRACARRHGHRHLPARPAAAQERVVRRLADRHGARPRRGALAPLDDALEDAAHADARRGGRVNVLEFPLGSRPPVPAPG